MSRSAQRRAAFRFCLTTLAWVACLFGWAAVLSFHAADWPTTSVWPRRLAVRNLCGPAGAWLAYQLFYYLGSGSYALLALLTGAAVAAARGARLSDPWLRLVGLGLACTAVSAAGALFLPEARSALVTGPGGVLGAGAAHFLRGQLGMTGMLIVLATSLLVGLLLAADELIIGLVRWAAGRGRRQQPALGRPPAQLAFELEAPQRQRAEEQPAGSGAPAAGTVAGGEERLAAAGPAGAVRLQPLGGALPAARAAGEGGCYELPPLRLLDDPAPIDEESVEILCREKAYVLEQTLNEFRLEVQVVKIETGPVITVFELKLAPGIKVSQIASLANDMARALKAPAVRVVAPLPGRNTVGIEVPNIDKEKVRLKEVMQAGARAARHCALPLFLGKDASGQPLVYDLTLMPHLLIAGTTGSGKSVCVSSIIMSILMTRSPREVNLVLVDPKVVELATYKEVPHLICPIVTELSRAEAILDWAATKMDERYALFAEAGVKDIRAYNRLGRQELRQRFQPVNDEELARIPEHLPYIVIIIDELADLMMTSAKEVEFYLCRLAQKSRAVGIHLVVSTQRPQANVVTGLIKSNLPCRIGFRVASRLDSRIVLDQNGGEVLMGQGDLLFLPPGTHKLIRAQGTFVSDQELRLTVRHCRSRCAASYLPELVRAPAAGDQDAAQRDELFDKAVDIILDTGRGSVSLLQRRLTIGYSRASRLIDQMYDAGIVGEYKGSQAREVVMTREQWQALRARREGQPAAQTAAD